MLQQIKHAAIAVAAIGALGLGGSAIADAASSQSTATATPSGSSTPSPRASFPAHGTAAHENMEEAVTGAAATKAQAAAVKRVGGGTAGAVTTDVSGDGYEVTVTRSDGSKVEVHLDGSFTVEQRHGG